MFDHRRMRDASRGLPEGSEQRIKLSKDIRKLRRCYMMHYDTQEWRIPTEKLPWVEAGSVKWVCF